MGDQKKGYWMTKLSTISIAMALAASASCAAYAQNNPNAPQPNSSGTGVNVPATSPTGQAIDRPDNGQSGAATRTTGSSAGSTKNVEHMKKSKDGGAGSR
jgi:hypothetical protein